MRKKIATGLSILFSVSVMSACFFIAADETSYGQMLPSIDDECPGCPAYTSEKIEEMLKQKDLGNACAAQIQPFLLEQHKDKINKISELFNKEGSDEDASAKVAEAFKIYQEYEDALNCRLCLFEEYSIYGNKSPSEAASSIAICTELIESQLDKARTMIESYALKMANVKKMTKLLRKYQHLNEKLSKVNRDMGRFTGYVKTMKARIPCFVKDCK